MPWTTVHITRLTTLTLLSKKMSLLANDISGFENILAAKLEVEFENLKSQFEKSYIIAENESVLHSLVKRSDFPVMHVKKGKKKRTCQNMNGILGGSNAFNFLSFVAGVITLVSLLCFLGLRLRNCTPF